MHPDSSAQSNWMLPIGCERRNWVICPNLVAGRQRKTADNNETVPGLSYIRQQLDQLVLVSCVNHGRDVALQGAHRHGSGAGLRICSRVHFRRLWRNPSISSDVIRLGDLGGYHLQ